jgi:hypothetical protein
MDQRASATRNTINPAIADNNEPQSTPTRVAAA